jgi:hypothetical protein
MTGRHANRNVPLIESLGVTGNLNLVPLFQAAGRLPRIAV